MLDYIQISKSRSVAVKNTELPVEAFEFTDHATDVLLPPIGHRPEQTKPLENITHESMFAYQHALSEPIRGELEHLHELERVYPGHRKILLNIGLTLRLAGRADAAIDYFRQLVQQSDNAEHKYLLAETYAMSGEKDIATALFSELESAGHALATLRSAEADVSHSDWDSAVGRADALLSADRHDWRAHMLKGTAALRRQEPRTAISHYRSALKTKSNSPSLYLNMAVAHHALGQHEQALEEAFRSLGIFPQFEPALRFVAELSCHSELRLEQAAKHLERHIQIGKPKPDLITRYAEIQYRLGNAQLGIDALNILRERGPIDPALLNNLGVLHSKHDRKTAQLYFHEALQSGSHEDLLSQSCLIATRNLAASLSDDRRYQEVVRTVAAVVKPNALETIASDSDIAPLLVTHLHAVTETHGADAALELARKYLAIDSLDSAVRVDIGNITTTLYCFGPRDLQAALQIARTTFEATEIQHKGSSRFTAAANNLAYVLLEQGNRAEAAQILSEIAHAVGRDSFITATFGLNAFRKGDLARAEEFYRRAVQIETRFTRKNQLKAKRDLETIRLLLSEDRVRDANRVYRRLQKLGRKARNDWVVGGITKQAHALIKGAR